VSAVIQTSDLSKRYGDVIAVDCLSLEVRRGEIYGFLGLNGAGKTTTIRTLLGLIRPTSGRAEVLGMNIHSGSAKPWSSVGYLVETPYAYPELTVRENLDVMRRLRPRTEPEAVSRVIEQLGLSAYADRRTSTLSLGNAQRLGLAKALLHKPRLLVLDEPANGLDPAGIVEVRELLLDLVRNQGVTVFMSSHILGEVARLATRIGIIHKGRLLMERNTDELERDRQRRLLVDAREKGHALSTLRETGYDAGFTPDGSIEVRDVRALEHAEEIARLLVQQNNPPTLLRVEQEDLESFFLRLVGTNGGVAW
jgi:ABC-2 type transport system ATP-binding protein